ncbi:GAF domain-containing sensor histidine kinase [Rhodohalobacter mucosus]|uniref:histidine kinase n=1 Tax=Rhodohalobacter mucosus TaxID=2079485 RepID=A0A316TM64_9BACT|nr:GAF domain-containing sensor histidine kinase [Rhodohalobacter mucosus]PWN05677.1 hypothetical protein DDZ15_13900 [Rhodohalobacter mucosus]
MNILANISSTHSQDLPIDPVREKERLESLQSYDVLDTGQEKEFDDLTRLAAEFCDAPAAMVNLIDEHRQWTKSVYGRDENAGRELPRNESICRYTIYEPDYLEVQDLSADSRFNRLSYVNGYPNLRYYLGVPLKDNRGNGIGALCVLDTKPRSMSEQQIRQLFTIASQVMARLDLHRRNDELIKLNEHKVTLMQMLSHDMRSPINGVIGMSSILADEIDDEDHREMVSILEQSAIQLNQMVDEIMNYSLIETNGFQLQKEATDISETVDNIEKLYKPFSKAKGIGLSVQNDIEAAVFVDKNKFEQILGNLISNALKFTREGGHVNASLALQRKQDGGHVLKLDVEDNGIGMEAEKASALFDESSKLSRSGTSGEKGTGLGLSIIKYFVDLHAGNIEVKSWPGKGTVFTVTIPVAIA